MVFRLTDNRYSRRSKFFIFSGYVLILLGILSLISAIPREVPSIIDLSIIEINIGTQLDIIRLIIGLILCYVGYKGVKLEWQ